MHQDIRDHYQKARYLLQVWTNKGEMIFEKPLQKSVANWNISDNIFVFQETRDSEHVFVVKLCDDDKDGQPCEPYKTPMIYRFSSPSFAA